MEGNLLVEKLLRYVAVILRHPQHLKELFLWQIAMNVRVQLHW